MHVTSRIHECFKSLAYEQPSAPAVITDDGGLTYAALNSASDTLARELCDRGIGSEEPIGVFVERSADLPTAFLAILKAGGVYVPMVANLPADRLANMAQQAGIRRLIVLDGLEPPATLVAVLTNNGTADTAGAIIRPDSLPADPSGSSSLPALTLQPDALAAILFTSGSTGTPKGVMIQHDACANMALGHIQAHGISREDRILLSASPGFILGFRELCLPLMSGAAFVPVTRATIDVPNRLLELMSRHRVTIAMFTPSYLRLLKGVVPQGLRCIITAGERPNTDDARHYGRQLAYWNVHGATEVCGTICMHRVQADGTGPLPSGRPFANTSVHLLDEQGMEVPQGETGEIHVVGIGVSRGYLNQPELTAGAFIETRFGRAYRTRDLGRWNADGNLETFGRSDDFVKVSGQSVSLGEIERALQHYPGVRRAAALQRNGRLVAWVECPDPDRVRGVDWREFLGKTLPSYMIPSQVAALDGMPINSAGKVDRQALLERADSVFESERERAGGTPPRGDLEREIAGIWEELLDLRPIMREDNFFTIGGTSLLAIAVSQRLLDRGHNVPVQMVLASLTIETLAARITEEQARQPVESDASPLENVATADQEDFWIAAEIGLTPGASHIVRILSINGSAPQPHAWHRAWNRLTERHAALRTAFFPDDDGRLCWHTVAMAELAPPPLFSFDHCATVEDARDIVARWANERFRFSEPPLARAGLITVHENNESLFWIVLHHAVVDGISASLIQEEMLALLAERPLAPAPHGIALASYAQQKYLASDRAAADREFWHARLDSLVEQGGEAFTGYVAEQHRPAVASGRGAPPLIERLGPDTTLALARLAKASGTGLHALLLALLAVEVRRRSGNRDIIVGSGVSIRPAGGETAVGHFVNLLPVVLRQRDEVSFTTLLRRTQTSLTETVEHAAYPGGLLSREFRQRHPSQRPHSRSSLFDIALTAILPRTSVDRERGIILAPRTIPGAVEYAPSGLDLSFSHEPSPEDGGGLNLLLVWNPEACSEGAATAWLSSLAAWARWLADKPERADQPLPAVLPHEAALLEQWEHGPNRTYPNRRGHEIFEELADRQPQRLAVLGREHAETGVQLDARANGIAHSLIQRGCAPGTTVAVFTGVSTDLPATVLGIWKAGGVYLPLPHELPPARLATMARDAGARLLVALDRLAVPELLTDSVAAVIRPEKCPPSEQRPRTEGSAGDLAYVIYTSGTTGTPKAIPITHAAYVNTLFGVAERVGLRQEDRMSLAASVGFDASLWELGHGLLNGITLVPVSRALRDDPWLLKRYYRELGVTIAFHTPTYLRVSEQVPFEGLRILFTGGEAPNHRDARLHADQMEFWNFYGPTEATIVVSGSRIMVDPPPDTPLPVGRPLPNVRISVRREDGTPVPPGQRGELWLGGAGIATGYLNRPDLSAASFVTTPEGRFYRSGDHGRWTTDGQIEISGRTDDQVKLNGQRVELGEIEQTLRLHPQVRDAVVLVESVAADAKVVRAFVRRADDAVTETILTEFLSRELPVHMLPASITPVSTIPLTPAGKIDRGALIEHARREAGSRVKEAPRGELEVAVAAIWTDLLGGPVAREDNFFALGGNSLLAVALAHRVSESLSRQVPARLLFTSPTLSAFVHAIATQPSAEEPAAVVSETDLTTEGEREFWVAEAAGLDTRTFIIPVQRVVTGAIEPNRVRDAWATLVERHDGLRSYFEEDGSGQPRRRIASRVDVTLETASSPDRATALAHIRQRQSEPLWMRVAPLWRLGLVEADKEGERFFWLALHHAIGDGQSVGTLLDEMTLLLDDGVIPTPDNGGRLIAAREQVYVSGRSATEDAAYWRTLLNDVPDEAFAEWPLDRARSAETPPGTHRFQLFLDARTNEGLKALARRHESSLHAVMLSLLALDLMRWTDRNDMLIGTTASIRETAADARIVGYGVNMLPLYLRPAADQSFGDLLRATQLGLARALQHARYPFARIYRDVWNERPELRHPQRYPLFDIAITENPSIVRNHAPQRFTRVATTAEPIGYELTGYSPGQDIVLIHEDLPEGGLLLQWHVNAAVYSAETARNRLESLVAWARWLAEDPARGARSLPHLLPEEEQRLAVWEQGETVTRPPVRFHELFETVADRPGQAERPAVITPAGCISYRSLDEDANAIAHALLLQGLGHTDVVGVLTDRSPRLPAAMLGIWKAGGVYLPLAADLPPERLLFMARDAGATRLIALDGVAVPTGLAEELSPLFRPEELSDAFRRTHRERPSLTGQHDDLAYILYTSGSTGQPKGTLIGHDSYVNLLLGAAGILGLTPNDRYLMFASPSFDVSLSDIGTPLTCGAAICPAPSAIIESPNRFLDFLRDQGVTVADLTPTYLRLFDGAELPPTVHTLITGGEPPYPADVAIYAARVKYFNAYGPTENTITSSMGALRVGERGVFSIGRPLPNTSVHIRGRHGQPLPPGVTGEIWLGGTGLAQGYLNRPEQTDASFVDTPAGRRYRTGDLGRWRPDGTIEILGRIDDQVKLNGIRIELGEIEHALTSHPAILQAVALLAGRDGGPKSLWAVVLPLPGKQLPREEAWRAHLTQRLPSHMIPSGVIPVPAIPVTSSGKVDRSALLALLAEQPASSGLTPPQDDLERSVAEVWAAILGQGPIHREDNFFALGGHSLLAIAVAHRLETLLGRPVPAREIFANPTLSAFAGRLRVLPPPEPVVAARSDLATEGQREFWTAEQAGLDTRGFTIPLTRAVQGDVPPYDQWFAAWNELISRHDALRSGFREDESGILRRMVVARLETQLEFHIAADADEGLDHIRACQAAPFAMSTPGLCRAGLVQVADDGQTFFWLALHHAVGDGLSLGVLIEELATLLRGERLAPPLGSLDRVAGGEELYLGSAAARADADYWRNVLGDLNERVPDLFDEWPLDKPRPRTRTARSSKGAHCCRYRLETATADGLRRLSRHNGASLHALMLALLGIEVQRRTGRAEFLLGTAASTRQSAAEARTVGYFVNMLPLPCRAAVNEPIEVSLRAMQQRLAEALQHCHYPFARIYGDFRREHPQATDPGRYPLFDSAVTENPGAGMSNHTGPWFSGIGFPDHGSLSYELRQSAPAQDLVLIHESLPDGGILLTWFANAALYTRDTAHAWLEALIRWMRFVADEQQQGKALPSLLPEEQHLLNAWQQGPSLPMPSPSFPDLFRRLAETHPEHPAIVTKTGVQSFAEVNARSDILASTLLDRTLRRGEPVAVFTERSAALPETVLAIWKAGGCYLPLSADLPAERLAFIAADAGIRILVALDGLPLPSELALPGYTVLRPEEPPATGSPSTRGYPRRCAVEIAPDDQAYIIYTSGSTGVPKGVVLCHGGLLNLGVGMTHTFGTSFSDRVLQISSPSFDAWIGDLMMAWSAGAAIVPIRREEMNDIDGMRDLFKRRGVTIATMPPSYLRLFERTDLSGLRILMTAGEPPIPDDARHYAARLSYFNGYGPTENTVAASFGPIRPDAESLAAGRPVANTSVHIVGSDGSPLPPGVVGEIWLGGQGLARGYLNRPELTAASFVGTGSERRYRTGDLGRWLRSGELQVLGRLDSQVKLRGQRVELGEIEYHLARYPGVRQAVALVETEADRTQTLWAFVALAPEMTEPDPAVWSAYLAESLPTYMIPAAVVRVEDIPVTAAGKVDRQALLAHRNNGSYDSHDPTMFCPPQTGIEKRIALIWSELLNHPRISRRDNFFNLGADSLRAIAVITRLRREFDCQVNDLYENPVLSDFARVCRPRRDHLRELIGNVCAEWKAGGDTVATEADREEALKIHRAAYGARVASALECDLRQRNSYRHLLLTGATGYLGSYLLRELLSDREVRVTALVRGDNDRAARERLGQVLSHYFGDDTGAAIRDNPNLTVLAADLRHADLRLAPGDHDQLAATVDAIYHCAANVNHFGHYRDFHADNVLATRHLLSLAKLRKAATADFHHISTLSVAGSASHDGFRLFTEYDLVPSPPNDNYYVRSKQEAERLVIEARGELSNTCIHRVGNVVFASDSARLQRNIPENAFFRQLAAFIHLGVVPLELHASLCYVDIAARAIVALARVTALANEIHHIEKARLELLADFIRTGDGMAGLVRACDFGGFLERLRAAVDEPEMEMAVAETVETFGIQADRSPLARYNRLAIASDRTDALLDRLGVVWPDIPAAGQNAMLRAARETFRR